MEQREELPDLKRILKRRKWWLILPTLVVIVTSTVIALLLPNVYKSSAVILIQNQQIPEVLVQSTVTSFVEQRIQAITQEANSRSKILRLVENYDLLPDKRKKLATEDLVERIRDRIKIEPINTEVHKQSSSPVLLTIAFSLSFEDENPKKAQMVATEISSYYVEKNLESRERHTRGTTEFLHEQLNQVKAQIDALETRRAQYREAHLEALPEFTALNMQKLEKLNADVSNINLQLRSLNQQRAGAKNQLALLDPYSDSSARVLSPTDRLQQTRLERAELDSKYSEKHPAAQAKNREIALLEQKVKDAGDVAVLMERRQEIETNLADLRSRYTDAHPDVKATLRESELLRSAIEETRERVKEPNPGPAGEAASNPPYVSLNSDMEKTEIVIASLNAELTRLEEQSKVLSGKLHAMPQVAIEYNEMNTDYEIAKAHYNEIQQKLLSAEVSKGMEEEKLGETFQIVEPAFLPEEPYKPNRLAILLIGLVLGTGISVGLASLREYTDKQIHDVKALETCTGMPVFSAIPRIVTREDKIRTRKRRIALAACTIGGIAVVLVAVHLFVIDLYVLYTRGMRFLLARLSM